MPRVSPAAFPNRFDLVMLGLAGGFAALVALAGYPLGSANTWVLRYRSDPFLEVSTGLITWSVLMAVLIIASPRWLGRIAPGWLVAALGLACMLMNLGLHRPFYGQVMVPRTLANSTALTNPFLARGVQINDVDAYIADHRERAIEGHWAQQAEHRRLTAYPPGLPLFYRLLHGAANTAPFTTRALVRLGLLDLGAEHSREQLRLSSDDSLLATATLASLMHLMFLGLIPVATRAVVCLYADPETAYRTAVLTCFVPGLHLFAATPAMLFPALGLVIGWTTLTALNQKPALFLGLSALLITVGTSMTFAILPFGLMALLFILLLHPERPWPRRLSLAASWLACGVGFYLICRLFAFDIVERFLLAMTNNQTFYLVAKRTYLESSIYNVVTFLPFAGLLWAGSFIARVRSAVVELRRHGWRSAELGSQVALIFAGVLLFLFVSGSTRGEVERNWALMMPWVVIVGAPVVLANQRRYAWFCAASVVITLVMALMIETTFVF